MAELKELLRVRRQKRDALRRAGKEPYPETTPTHAAIRELTANFDARVRRGYFVGIAGRITRMRSHGGIVFLDIEDGSGKIQSLLSKAAIGEKQFSLLAYLDLGDFLFLRGVPKRTKRGEPTIFANTFIVLAKALRPLPSEWYGLRDVEERFRGREIDLLFNPDVAEKFRVRSAIIRELRKALERAKFLEVETPILQPIPGGAHAEPFRTTLRALRLPLYLRVAPELYLKRLLVGGFERVFELGRNFRNEGMDHAHNPEFTELEFYWAYQDQLGLMRFSETLLRSVVRAAKKTLRVPYRGRTLDFHPAFRRYSFEELLRTRLGIPSLEANERELRAAAKRYTVDVRQATSRPGLLDQLFKKAIVPKIFQPSFVTHHPLAATPLAKAWSRNPRVASRFQIVAGGIELANAYAELNDPDEQRKRFIHEHARARAGDLETQRLDEDFITALEYGMPPAAGFGLGVDRLTMLLTDSASLREVLLFPTMRPMRRKAVRI